MKKKILALFLLTAMALSLVACGKQKDTGIVVSVGDTNNDTGNNDMTAETNDVEESTETVEDEEPVISDDESMQYITGGFVAENGDVYKFNVDGTYNCFVVENESILSGTYTTDGKSSITLTCTSDSSLLPEDTEVVVEETTDPNAVPVAYKTTEPSEDGQSTIVTEYDELGNILNQYVINDKYKEETEIVDYKDDKKDNNKVISEVTYKLSKTTTTDEYENVIEVVILSKGDTKIVLRKQFELN